MARKRSTHASVRYLVKRDERYYWTPAYRDRSRPDRPAWLKNTPLGTNVNRAIAEASELNERLDQWRSGSRIRGGTDAILREYLASPAFAGLADRTRSDYLGHIARLREIFGDFEPDSVKPSHVIRYHDALLAAGTSERQASYRIAVMSVVFGWARLRGLVEVNPADRLRIKAKMKTPKRAWTREQLKHVFSLPYPVGLAAVTALYSVQRQGDILAMAWPLVPYELTLTQSKTGQHLRLPIHWHWGEFIAERARLRYVFPDIPLINNRDGGIYTPSGFRSVWHKAVPRDYPTFHEIRHTATSWLREHLSDDDVRYWTGHKTGSMLDVYDRRTADFEAWRERSFKVMDEWPRRG